jgi:hypothetical protein
VFTGAWQQRASDAWLSTQRRVGGQALTRCVKQVVPPNGPPPGYEARDSAKNPAILTGLAVSGASATGR